MALAYISAGIESDLHKQITAEAKRNNQSFSTQIREYREHCIELDEEVNDLQIEMKALREQIKKITDVN
jgi:hypothetical protein